MIFLYHASTWAKLSSTRVGDSFVLQPGAQAAEGLGVYFSEEERISAADAIYNGGRHTATVVLQTENSVGWWRSKRGNLRRKNRSRTWHSAGKSVECQVIKCEDQLLYCSWEFV